MDLSGDFSTSQQPIKKEENQHSPSKGAAGQLDQHQGSPFEEDLMRQFNQKHSELSSFLHESTPDLPAETKTSIDSSPNDFPSKSNPLAPQLGHDFNLGISGNGIETVVGDVDISAKESNLFKQDIASEKTEAAGGDTKQIGDLMSDSVSTFERVSPNMMDFGFEASAPSPKKEKDNSLKQSPGMEFPPPPAPNGEEREGDDHSRMAISPSIPRPNAPTYDLHHGTQSEPTMHIQQNNSELLFADRTKPPQLPESPCLGPPSPVVSHATMEQRLEPEVAVCPQPPSPTYEENLIADVEGLPQKKNDVDVMEQEDYTRRETKIFDNEASLLAKNLEESGFKIGGSHFEVEKEIEPIPPPIPKHAYELDAPPPVPKHADESLFRKDKEVPVLHSTYDDQIEDEYEEDSIPLSHKLSDSLEVLKESPQKDLHLDSLMDLDELPSVSSSKNSLKSNSPNDNRSLIADLCGIGEPGPTNAIPPEMVESGIFSQLPPAELDNDPIEIDEKFTCKLAPEAEQTKPVASIPPFTKETQEYEEQELVIPMDASMTGSITLQSSLDEIQAPKFYESEDSSSKTDVINEESQKKKQKNQHLELDDLEAELLPKESFESFSSTISTSKLDTSSENEPQKTEFITNIIDEDTQKSKLIEDIESKDVIKPKQEFYNSEDGEISEEIEKILNIFNPKAWFDPAKLHPTVSELVYWRDPKKSGIVFGSVFVVLIALTLLSLISVIAYTSLAVLTGTFAFRVYKSVLQAVQKTNDGHPFKEYLDLDLTLPGEKAQELGNAIVSYLNTSVTQLRRLFLVEDLIDSAKFGAFLYFLTYIGSWFNGLTLLILSFVALFALPKVYETNKTVIDQYIDLVWGKVSEINAKVTAAVPFLKKEKAQ